MRRVVIEGEHGRAMRWFDANKAAEVALPDGRVLAVTGRGVVTVRAAGAGSAVEVGRDVAAELLTGAGLPLSVLTMPGAAPRRDSPGRPAEGVKVDVRIPEGDLAVLDAVAAEAGVSRAQMIRVAVADLVASRAIG